MHMNAATGGRRLTSQHRVSAIEYSARHLRVRILGRTNPRQSTAPRPSIRAHELRPGMRAGGSYSPSGAGRC
jgi:hypothetical protein